MSSIPRISAMSGWISRSPAGRVQKDRAEYSCSSVPARRRCERLLRYAGTHRHPHACGRAGCAAEPEPGPQHASKRRHYGGGCRQFRVEELSRNSRPKVIDHSKTRVLAFVNIVGAGMYGSKVEDDVTEMDAGGGGAVSRESIRKRSSASKQLIFSRATWDAVDRAVKAAEMSKTIVMVDFHPKPGRGYRELILQHMRPGDIHTHFYGRLTPQLDEQKKVQRLYVGGSEERRAIRRWTRFWKPLVSNRRPRHQTGLLPDTISTDMHKEQHHAAARDDDERNVEVSRHGTYARAGDRAKHCQSSQSDPAA